MPKIKKFDKTDPIPPETAAQIANLFEQNYPPMHPNERKIEECAERANQEALNALLDQGRVIFTAHDVHEKIQGLLEMREADAGDGVYMLLVWIIVDALAQNQGVSSALHAAFEQEAKQRAAKISKPSCLLLGVHPENSAKQVYEHWGYVEDGRTTEDGTIFMFKDF